jgi:hypothetical protein
MAITTSVEGPAVPAAVATGAAKLAEYARAKARRKRR